MSSLAPLSVLQFQVKNRIGRFWKDDAVAEVAWVAIPRLWFDSGRRPVGKSEARAGDCSVLAVWDGKAPAAAVAIPRFPSVED